MKPIDKSLISDFRCGVILAALALFAAFFFWSNLERLEYGLYDLGARLRMTSFRAPVCVVAIDERSLAEFGPWPWPRSYVAFMIDMLHAYEAKVIGVDMIYSDKDLNHGLREVTNIIKTIENNPQYSRKNISTIVLLAALKDAQQRLDNDAIMAESIANSRKVILPVLFRFDERKKEEKIIYPDYLTANTLFPYPSDQSPSAAALIVPIEPFARAAYRLGHINILADKDGAVRSEHLFIRYGDRIIPSFALQAALAYQDMDLADIQFGSKSIAFGHNKIPLVNNGMRIAFKRDIPYYEFTDVINKRVPAEVFNNKIVIIAPSTAALGELKETAVAYDVPSVKVIANVVENILSNDFIVRPDWAATGELAMILFGGLYLAFIIPRLRAWIGGLITLSIMAIWISTSLYCFAAYGYWIKAVYPAFVLLMGYIILVSRRYEVAPKS